MAPKTLSASQEDYLETIYRLISQNRVARVKDISERLNVKYSSVTGALRALARRKLVNYAPYTLVTLTSRGEVLAKDVIRRHEALREFFIRVLDIDEKRADEAACEMEHALSKDILVRLIRFADFVENCPQGGADWKDGVGYTCGRCNDPDTADDCRMKKKKEPKKRSHPATGAASKQKKREK